MKSKTWQKTKVPAKTKVPSPPRGEGQGEGAIE